MPKWFKWLVGIALLPVCWIVTRVVWRLAASASVSESIWIPFGAGVLCWLAIFLLLPRPTRVYVVGHEVTHVLWAWLFGGRVRRFHASSKGGYVVLTRSNFLVALAPYFFPLYAVVVVLSFLVGAALWNWSAYASWFYLLLGAAYSFHLTLTIETLKVSQSDITGQGVLFSATVIWLGNIAVLLLAVSLLTPEISLDQVAGLLWRETVELGLVIKGIP
jgi:hypothetical protein